MPETHLDYDKIIWEVFAVGVVSSVVMLYYFITQDLKGYGLWALILGFSILIYSFFLILGYGFKKSLFLRKNPGERIEELERRWYPRVRWIGEIILILIGVIYFITSSNYRLILFLILLIFIVIMCIANCCSRKKFERRNLGNGNWEKFWKWIKKYFC